jgi:hypothetical protein
VYGVVLADASGEDPLELDRAATRARRAELGA